MRGITLIGMPGSGKSTVGKILSQRLGLNFVDLDTYISIKEKKKIGVIVKKHGDSALSQLEERYSLKIPLKDVVFSPGGSIVYSEAAMKRLQIETVIFFLNVSFEEMSKRLVDTGERGIVGLREKSLEELYRERLPLYQSYAAYTVDATGSDPQTIADTIVSMLDQSHS